MPSHLVFFVRFDYQGDRRRRLRSPIRFPAIHDSLDVGHYSVLRQVGTPDS
jgi:hypothetical protein